MATKTATKMATKEKLLKLARFLIEEVKPEWFDLSNWADKGFSQKKCGTTACAAGWATVCFPRSGLKLRSGSLGSLEYRDELGFAAAMAFFGITRDEAYYLFDPVSYESPHNKRRNVAKRLREVAKMRKP